MMTLKVFCFIGLVWFIFLEKLAHSIYFQSKQNVSVDCKTLVLLKKKKSE